MKNQFILFCVVLTFFGCEDYLNKIPQTSLSPELYYTNDKKIELGVNGVYANLRKCYDTKDYAYWKRDAWTDNLIPGTDYSNLEELITGKMNQYSSMAEEMWSVYYATIISANGVLNYADLEDNISNPTIKRCIGELLFIRSLMYIDLVMVYGDIPLITDLITIKESMTIPRTLTEKVWEQIHADLDRAIDYLPVTYSSNNNGRATKGAAITLQARAYLYHTQHASNWDKVIYYTKLLTDNENTYNYNLYDDGTNDSYYNLFLTPYNKEIVFSVQYANDTKNWNSISNDKYLQQFDVSVSLINEFENNDGARVPVSDPSFTFFNKDPRFSASLLHIGGSLNKTNKQYFLGTNTTYAVSTRVKKGCDYTLTNMKQDYNHQILLRYSDVLLMQAEALNEVGDQAGAITLIKRVRDRVKLPTNIASTYEDVKQALMHERRIEFCFEGTRYFDIIRWDIGTQVFIGDAFVLDKNKMKTINVNTPQNEYSYPVLKALTYSFSPERKYLFPIPNSELIKNKELKQNKGY